ncbi:MAG: GNAT family N-acetyltransferase [Candidatus Methanomethylicaceae archaeon]
MEYNIRGNALTIRLDEKHLASVVFHKEGNRMYLDSTFTPEEYRGRGIGSELMKSSMDYAKKNSLLIVPVCSFAVEYFRKHREYSPIIVKS